MKEKQLHQPFELYISDIEEWEERALIYHFFEIVQILEGEGIRVVNENNFSYQKGDIFLFTPLDCRGFKSIKATKFCSIRFSEVFLTDYKSISMRERITLWLNQLEQIFYQHNRFQPVMIRNKNDGKMITNLIDSLGSEFDHKQAYFEDNLQHLITVILNLLSRNVINHVTAGNQHKEPLINKIVLHIRQNIYKKEELKVKYLATKFNLSANYVGEYFKKITGESLQDYIKLYKMKSVEQRLIFSDNRIGEIADELGFTDESHLSTQFKKHSGYSPTEYRKNKRPE
ncbi:AraC-like DNA-binding protein [Chitinophaga niastensis]|uniref:AraC-like DNA-binding protein n=1 Tax=Chitinophaga niastensis TaxID=536980 RepID=A0A2P8HU50_CHINA|nr:AraC family transcriptional regulator [Chitinophaga niastensis]PSL49759.1 AraC-like DNA-binding protein [Chitinophaga niastensis]